MGVQESGTRWGGAQMLPFYAFYAHFMHFKVDGTDGGMMVGAQPSSCTLYLFAVNFLGCLAFVYRYYR